MATPRRNYGLWIGLGAAGLAGYGIVRYVLGKRRHGEKEDTAQPAAEPDRPLQMVTCAGCGQTMKEYEFFCPYCGKPRDKK